MTGLNNLANDMRQVAIRYPRLSSLSDIKIYQRVLSNGVRVTLTLNARHEWRLGLRFNQPIPPAQIEAVKKAFGVPKEANDTRTDLPGQGYAIQFVWPEPFERLFEVKPIDPQKRHYGNTPSVSLRLE